jgi:formylglycine-generating enzyme required for sulfatase activity
VAWDGNSFALKIEKYARHPVIYVSWYGATEYCKWLGNGSRLPSENKWQYAAEGPEKRTYPWGNQPPDNTRANYGSQVQDTTEVGHYSPAGDSPFGAQDMAGNVWEWVQEWYAQDQTKVRRGGSWYYDGDYLPVSNRYRSNPASTLNYIGFRCARSH